VLAVAALLGPIVDAVVHNEIAAIGDPVQRAAAVNAARQTVLAAAAGVVAILGLTTTLQAYLLSRRAQYSDRYVRAVALLAAVNVDERIGGIYALEQVAEESEAERETVVDVLTAFVRRRAMTAGAMSDPPDSRELDKANERADVQAVLTVLGRRLRLRHDRRIDLSRLDLSGMDLRAADLRAADLSRANLRNADLTNAELRRADLSGANLTRAEMRSADLRDAHLTGAILEWVSADGADFRGCLFTAASIRHADLTGARLEMDELSRADVEDSELP
jgi:hypothetical protein